MFGARAGAFEEPPTILQKFLEFPFGAFPLHLDDSNLAIPSASLPATFEDSGVLPYVRA